MGMLKLELVPGNWAVQCASDGEVVVKDDEYGFVVRSRVINCE